MQYYVTGTSEFFYTETGKIGIALLIVGSLVSGSVGVWWLSALAAAERSSYSSDISLWFPVITFAGAIAAVAGLFMVFIGRFLRHDINVRIYEERQ